MRCLGVNLPSLMSSLLDSSMNLLISNKTKNVTTMGYTYACAALLGSVYMCPLGIPHIKIKIFFNIIEDTLCTAPNNRLQRSTMVGWILLSSFMSLGSCIVKNYLPKIIAFWKNIMPRNNKELEVERKKDTNTWQIILDSRYGALISLHSFLINCNEIILSDDSIVRRISNVIHGAILQLSQLPHIEKIDESILKKHTKRFRYRLYQVLLSVPTSFYEGKYITILMFLSLFI